MRQHTIIALTQFNLTFIKVLIKENKMAHITSIGAAMFTSLAVTKAAATVSDVPKTAAAAAKLFGATGAANGLFSIDGTGGTANGTFFRIPNVKEFPAMGIPANITNVPEYGSALALQVQSQADAPTLELTLNYVPSQWDNNTLFSTAGNPAVGGDIHLFRFTVLAEDVKGWNSGFHRTALAAAASGNASVVSLVENSSYYFLGKFEALEVTPNLTDALTAKLTISVRSSIYGAFTQDTATYVA
jgi:hypothetical protein